MPILWLMALLIEALGPHGFIVLVILLALVAAMKNQA
jgi:hypothetical protein